MENKRSGISFLPLQLQKKVLSAISAIKYFDLTDLKISWKSHVEFSVPHTKMLFFMILPSCEYGSYRMSSVGKEFDMKIDILHALEDFLDAYNNHSEMVVTEAIANAIDVRSSEIDIKLYKTSGGAGIISFHNNGPPMNKQQFDDYHVIARSSKSKGSSSHLESKIQYHYQSMRYRLQNQNCLQL